MLSNKTDLNKTDRHFVTYSKINISSGDFRRLLPGRWLNDGVTEFYVQYLLEERVAADIKDRMHLFLPFFYAKIAQKTPNWKLLRHQARRTKALEKECLIVPVCAQSHWRLIIVVNLDMPAKKGTIFAIHSLFRYPNEAIVVNVR